MVNAVSPKQNYFCACSKKNSLHQFISKEFHLSEVLQLPDSLHVSYRSFTQELSQYYGERIVDELKANHGSFTGSFISIAEVKHYLIGIAARVKRGDLRQFFRSIIGEERPLLCSNFLSFQEIEWLQQFSKFEDLTDKEIDMLLAAFRYQRNKNGDLQGAGSLFFPLKKFRKLPKGSDEFRKNLTMVRAFERADHFIQDPNAKNLKLRQGLAFTEHLAREIAYGIPLDKKLSDQIDRLKHKKILSLSGRKEAIQELIASEVVGVIFPTINENGQKVYYEIKSSVFENGLVAFFCAPLTPGQWVSQDSAKDSSYPVLAIFRGTWCKKSLRRDIESVEAGEKSFNALSAEIIEQFERAIPNDAGNVKVKVTGHSLGSSDAQRFAGLVAKIRSLRLKETTMPHESKVDKVTALDLTTWNSPGLRFATCIDYSRSLRAIKRSHFPITFTHTHVKVGEDGVQVFGRALLGWVDPKWHRRRYGKRKIANPETQLIKFERRDLKAVLGTTLYAHTRPCLSVDARNPKMKVMDVGINTRLGPRSFLNWVWLILKAIFRRICRIPELWKGTIKIIIGIKKRDKTIHQLFKQCAIRKQPELMIRV